MKRLEQPMEKYTVFLLMVVPSPLKVIAENSKLMSGDKCQHNHKPIHF